MSSNMCQSLNPMTARVICFPDLMHNIGWFGKSNILRRFWCKVHARVTEWIGSMGVKKTMSDSSKYWQSLSMLAKLTTISMFPRF
jgi:hypothetical protein